MGRRCSAKQLAALAMGRKKLAAKTMGAYGMVGMGGHGIRRTMSGYRRRRRSYR